MPPAASASGSNKIPDVGSITDASFLVCVDYSGHSMLGLLRHLTRLVGYGSHSAATGASSAF